MSAQPPNWKHFAAQSLQFQEEAREQFAHLERETGNIPLLVQRLDDLVKELKGNGQPGRLAVMEKLLQGHEQMLALLPALQQSMAAQHATMVQMGERISRLERWRWGLGGAIAVLTPITLWVLQRILS